MRPIGERERIVDAMVSVVAEAGYEDASVAAVVARAGATRADFRRHFQGKDDCCRAAFDELCERFDCHLLPIYLRPGPWRRRMRAAAYAAGRYCEQHEAEVRFVIGERFRHGHLPLGERSLRLHIAAVDSVREELAPSASLPGFAAEFAIGSFLELVIKRHAEGAGDQIEAAIPDLLYSVNGAFFGAEAAAAELELDLQDSGQDEPVDGPP